MSFRTTASRRRSIALLAACLLLAPAPGSRSGGVAAGNVTSSSTQTPRPRLVFETASRTMIEGETWRGTGGALDLCIAVGPDRILEVSNVGIALSTKEGELVAQTDSHTLFDVAMSDPGIGATYDPDAIFDPDSGRFFIYAVGQLQDTFEPCTEGCVAYEYLAVSRSSSPGGFTPDDWHFYELPVTPERGQTAEYWGDGTTLGVNERFLGVSMHLYGWGNGQPGVDDRLRVLHKGRLVRGKSARWHDFRDVDNLTVDWPEAYSPAQHLSPSDTFFAVQTVGADMMVLGVRGTARRPKLKTWMVRGQVEARFPPDFAGGPPTAPQPGDVPRLQAWSGNTTAIYRDGSIWLTETTPTVVRGTGVTGIRVIEIDVSEWPRRPRVARDLLLAAPDDWNYHPALAVDASGNVLVVHASSSARQAVSVEYTWLPAGGVALRPSRLLKAGTGPFIGDADDSRFPDVIRFADYFAASFDPVDGTLWLLGQYGGDRVRPTAWIGAFRFE